jgi:hypothetical protein
MEKLRPFAAEFLKIFLLYLGIRLVLKVMNGEAIGLTDLLRNHIPFAALLAFLYALIRFLLRPGKK